MKHLNIISVFFTIIVTACYAEVIEIQNPQQFKDIIQHNSHVVADFYAPWCQPCLRMAPFFDAVSQENNNVVFVKLNHSNDLVKNSVFNDYHVHSFPTIILFRNGQPIQVRQGNRTAAQLRRMVQELLAS